MVRETVLVMKYQSCAEASFTIKLTLAIYDGIYSVTCGPGSSVSIVTDYGLDGQGSDPGGDEIFHPSTPALWPTQPPVQWVPGLSRG